MRRALLRSQIVLLILSFIWGIYVVALWRTQEFGMAWPIVPLDAGVALIFVMPIAVVGVLGLPWRKASLLLLMLCIGMIALAEIYACAQEWLVIDRYGENPDQSVTVGRWPPFSNHHITYAPECGWVGGD